MQQMYTLNLLGRKQMNTFNILSEAGMLACKTVENPMEPNTEPTKDDETGPLYLYAQVQKTC